MWSRIPPEMSLTRITSFIKSFNVSSTDSKYKKDNIDQFLNQVINEIQDVNYTLQSCTILLGLRNDQWVLQALADVDSNNYNPRKIEEFLLRTQHLPGNLLTPNAPQVFLTPSKNNNAFISSHKETAM